MHPSDQVLAARAATLGDADAFEMLMRRHESRIYQQLRRFTRDAGLAEELCQETFLRAWRKLASFDGRGAFAGWLSRLAYNVFLQDLRRNRHRRLNDSLDDPRLVADEAPAAPEPAQETADLDRLLAAVSPDEQRLLTLSYAGGLSASEIADILGTSTGTVKSQIHRAKEKIRRRFGIAPAA